jgi:hypothetical protein
VRIYICYLVISNFLLKNSYFSRYQCFLHKPPNFWSGKRMRPASAKQLQTPAVKYTRLRFIEQYIWKYGSTPWRSWLKHCITNRKVAGSTVWLASTLPLTEKSTRNTSCGVNATGTYGWKPYHLHVSIVCKSGRINLLETSGPAQACAGIGLQNWKYNATPHTNLTLCESDFLLKCLVIFRTIVSSDIAWRILTNFANTHLLSVSSLTRVQSTRPWTQALTLQKWTVSQARDCTFRWSIEFGRLAIDAVLQRSAETYCSWDGVAVCRGGTYCFWASAQGRFSMTGEIRPRQLHKREYLLSGSLSRKKIASECQSWQLYTIDNGFWEGCNMCVTASLFKNGEGDVGSSCNQPKTA